MSEQVEGAERLTGTKRLMRSRTDRMIGGVCGGLAEYFGIDSVLVRLVFLVGLLMTAGGGFVLAYLVLLVVMPEAPETDVVA